MIEIYGSPSELYGDMMETELFYMIGRYCDLIERKFLLLFLFLKYTIYRKTGRDGPSNGRLLFTSVTMSPKMWFLE